MTKLIGYARVSAQAQGSDSQIQDLLSAGVHRDDLYVDQGQSGALDKRPILDKALDALRPKDTLVITTLDRIGRSTQKLLDLAEELSTRDIGLRILNLSGDDVDTKTPIGTMVFTVMAALAQMELELKHERIIDSMTKRRIVGGALGGRHPIFTVS